MTKFLLAILLSSFVISSIEVEQKFQNMHSHVAGRLELVVTDSVLINIGLFANKSVDRMHVNDANPEQFIAQAKVNNTQMFCVIDRKSMLTECNSLDECLVTPAKSKITLAALIDSGRDIRKLAGCYETYAKTLTCFIGDKEIGTWKNRHLKALRYLPKNNANFKETIEAVVTHNGDVYITHGDAIYPLTNTVDNVEISVAFINQNLLALAYSVDKENVLVYLCNLSPNREKNVCTENQEIFAGSGATSGDMGFLKSGRQSNDYTFLFIRNNALFTKGEMLHIWDNQPENSESFLFDRRQLIVLSKHGYLRYINVGYRSSADAKPLYASGSLQAIDSQLEKLNGIHGSFCARLSSNGNNSLICTGEPYMVGNDSVIPIVVFNSAVNHGLSSMILNLTLPGIEAIFCQVAAVDRQNQILAYCCKVTTNMVICKSNGIQTNHTYIDDFNVGYDFNKRKITVALYKNNWTGGRNVYAFVEGESITQTRLTIPTYSRVLGANIDKYNSIILAAKDHHRYTSFFKCFIRDDITCHPYATRVNVWQIPLPVGSTDDESAAYSFDFINAKTDEFNLIGLHHQPITYLTIETSNEKLAIILGKSFIFQSYTNCTKFIVQSSVVTLFCCNNADNCGLIRFRITNNGTALLAGYIPDDQDECSHDQGDGGSGICSKTLTKSTRPMCTRPIAPKKPDGFPILIVIIIVIATLLMIIVVSTIVFIICCRSEAFSARADDDEAAQLAPATEESMMVYDQLLLS